MNNIEKFMEWLNKYKEEIQNDKNDKKQMYGNIQEGIDIYLNASKKQKVQIMTLMHMALFQEVKENKSLNDKVVDYQYKENFFNRFNYPDK